MGKPVEIRGISGGSDSLAWIEVKSRLATMSYQIIKRRVVLGVLATIPFWPVLSVCSQESGEPKGAVPSLRFAGPTHPLETRRNPHNVKPGAIPDRLRSIAVAIRANFGRIRTWTAEFEFQDIALLAGIPESIPKRTGELWRHSLGRDGRLYRQDNGRVVIHCDFATDLLRSDFRVEKTRYQNSDKLTELPYADSGDLFYQRSIVAADSFWQFEPIIRDQGPSMFVTSEHTGFPQSGRMAFRDARVRSEGQQWGIVIDPRQFFGRGGPDLIWEELQRLSNAIAIGEMQTALTELLPNRPIDELLRMQEWTHEHQNYVSLMFALVGSRSAPANTYHMFTLVFSESAGYNLVWFGETDSRDRLRTSTNWEFQRESGVLVPARIVHLQSRDGETIRFQRILTCRTITLNEKQNETLYTVAGLGLRNGERVIDRVSSRAYVYRDGKLTEPIDFEQVLPGGGARLVNRWPTVLVFLGTFTAAVLLYFRVIHRPRRFHP